MPRTSVTTPTLVPTEYIRTRLVALDFILGKLDYKFFETEQEKVHHFTEQLAVDKKYLPAKRYAGAGLVRN